MMKTCPEGWLYAEVKDFDTGGAMILMTCSDACRASFWKPETRLDSSVPDATANSGAGVLEDRDREWREALSAEFKIGGAIRVEDDKWVKEKTTLPERWARIVRLAVTPPDVKLHDYPPPTPIVLDAPVKRDLLAVMERLRPLLVQGKVDLEEFERIKTSVGFTPPENEKLYWGLLCEFLEESLPPPMPDAPEWVREVADIIAGKK